MFVRKRDGENCKELLRHCAFRLLNDKTEVFLMIEYFDAENILPLNLLSCPPAV